MSNPVLGSLGPSGDIRMEIFKTLMTSKDASGYARLIPQFCSRPESKFLPEAQLQILAEYEAARWPEVLLRFKDPVCLFCPGTLMRVAGALENLGLTEMTFQVTSLCRKLVSAIEGTGDGSEARPYLILNPTAAEFWLRDVKKLTLGKPTQIQRETGWGLAIPSELGSPVWFDVTAHALGSSGKLEGHLRKPSDPTLPQVPVATQPPKNLTPAKLPVFNPTETRFGARKPGSRPTLTNITAPATTAPEREPERHGPPLSNDATIQAIKQRLGDPDFIIKGTEALPPIDIHYYKPARRRDFHTLITVGMSSLPMTVPEGSEAFRFAELMLLLPHDWPVSKQSLSDDKSGWPIMWQLKLARYVHDSRAWFHHLNNFGLPTVGQTLHPSTKFSAWLMVRSETMGTVLDKVPLPDGRIIHFYAMTAIYPEENEFKMKEIGGGEQLWDRMRAANFTDVLFPSRRNIIAPRPSKTVEFPHP